VLATAKMAAPAPRPSPPPQPGSEILEPLRRATAGDYDIAGELGRGGMATVFLAHDIALDRKVAIKVMTPSLVTGAGMVERFKREARTAASLSHPHIIPIYAVRETDRLLYFVMKFVEGRSLDTVIREQGPLPIALVQAVMAQVGGALGYAHRRGIVHRDMKPANIMLDDEGWAVVTDFGIAKVADARGLTMTGVTIGTPSYMSPEQCASKEISGATDQYSLGIVAFELLTGRVPFDADSLMGIMWKHFNEPPPPIRDARPDCPQHIADAIARMLAKDPAARWPTMEDAVAAIGQPPMAPGDPIRQQMRVLAMGGSATDLLDRVHTPASPIPVTPDAPTMPSGPAPSMPTPPPTPAHTGFPGPAATPPPTPAPTGSGTTGRPPSVADVPTVLTGDAPTMITSDAPTMLTGDAPTVVTPHAATGPATAPRPSVPLPPPGPPVAPSHVTAAVEPAPAPRRRGLLLGLGLAAVAVISAGAVWFVMSLGSSEPAEPGQPDRPDTVTTAPEPAPIPVASVDLTPGAMTITEGETGEIKAFLLDTTTVPVLRPIEWRSLNTGVATVQAGQGVAGIVTAVRAGTARIIALSEGKADTATVTVTAGRAVVTRVVIQLQADTLAPGDDPVPIAALAQDARGNTLGRRPEWEASPPGIVRIAGGQVTPVKDGAAQIVAVADGVRSAPVRVVVATPRITSVAILGAPDSLPQGGTARLGVEVRDARGRTVSSPTVTWSSSSNARATVSQGMLTARATGEVTVTASVAGVSGNARIRVVPPPQIAVARLNLTRQTSSLEVGRTHSVGASAQSATGTTLTDRAITWSSSDTRVATVSQEGIITAVAAGKTTITATSEGQRQSFDVEVTAAPPSPPPVGVDTARPPPVIPVTPAVTAAAIGLGAEVSCAALGDGSASCWGTGAPARVTDLNALRIVTGSGHACALLGNGSVRCWGANANGQLGNGETSRTAVVQPVALAGELRFRSITAGATHTCGIATDRSAWCWGRGNDGQLGNSSTRDASAPVAVARELTYLALAAGEKHTCGVATDGKVYCWGDGFANQLGIGIAEQRRTPDEARLRETATGLASGRNSTCVTGTEGGTYCWGGGFGSAPRRIQTEQRFTQLAVGDEFACGLTGSGAVWCWGRNNRGQLGDGGTRNQSNPVQVATDGVFTSIAAGNAHACGITRDGPTICWGDNAKGQVGAGAAGPVPTPVSIEIRR
jgi:serine/threonine protein kinase/alpha-tubulin suppressor-like RCC1 family protein